MPTQREREFDRFDRWARLYGMDMPVDGEQVGIYLLEMMVDGKFKSLAAIERAANAIAAYYNEHGLYLELKPIERSLEMAAAQLAPDRVLN